jgi:hypothetical protein
MALALPPKPFALSLSKGCVFLGSIHPARSEGQGFDKLSPNGDGL